MLAAILAVSCNGDTSKNPRDAVEASHDAGSTHDGAIFAPDARAFDSGHAGKDAAREPGRDATVVDAGKHAGQDAGHRDSADASARDGSSPSIGDFDARSIRYGGHEDGPSMHTGDATTR